MAAHANDRYPTKMSKITKITYGYVEFDSSCIPNSYTHYILLSDGTYELVRNPVDKMSSYCLDKCRQDGEKRIKITKMKERMEKKRLKKSK